MTVIICPGVHPPQLTHCFLAALGRSSATDLIVPTDRYPPYSGLHILQFLREQLAEKTYPTALPNGRKGFNQQIPLLFIGFSAGVVGAMVAAHSWQLLGGQVKALIALDGWGVPLFGRFPIHRVSHDALTHWSSIASVCDDNHFYADPSVGHLDLWRLPQLARGYRVQASGGYRVTTAAKFIQELLEEYNEAQRIV